VSLKSFLYSRDIYLNRIHHDFRFVIRVYGIKLTSEYRIRAKHVRNIRDFYTLKCLFIEHTYIIYARIYRVIFRACTAPFSHLIVYILFKFYKWYEQISSIRKYGHRECI